MTESLKSVKDLQMNKDSLLEVNSTGKGPITIPNFLFMEAST